MFKLVVLSALLGLCVASYGGQSSGGSQDSHSIELPIKSKHDLEVIKTPSHREESSTKVDIPSGVLPVYMTFKTQSSPLYVKQEHRGTKGSSQKTESHDEPHRLVHEVTKPVLQELREVITPYRKVVQIIEKVQEERQTRVHKKEGESGGSSGGNSGDSEGYGNGGSSSGYGKSSSSGSSSGYGNGGSSSGYGMSSSSGSSSGYGKGAMGSLMSKGSMSGGSSGYGKNDDNDNDNKYGSIDQLYKRFGLTAE